jgi:large subunit ribosomal protein L5
VAARLKEQYNGTVKKELHDKYKYSNVMEVPKLEKVVINMGCGDAASEARLLEMAMAELGTITGQKPSPREARKSVSNFKIREGQRIGCTVTLRGDRMYEFIDRLFNVAMPRIRDFRGVSEKAFDNGNNYTLGLKEQTMFPEINMDKVQVTRGMNVTFVIKGAKTREESYDLLLKLGMPFQNKNTEDAN